jgi:hypothetical protein
MLAVAANQQQWRHALDGRQKRVVELRLPQVGNTFSKAGLSPHDRATIITTVKQRAFDTPPDWSSELVVRWTRVGTKKLLIIRGSDLLCGGTGNCQTWVLQRTNGKWLNRIPGDPPIIASLSLRTDGAQSDLVGCRNQSVASSKCTSWHFGRRH